MQLINQRICFCWPIWVTGRSEEKTQWKPAIPFWNGWQPEWGQVGGYLQQLWTLLEALWQAQQQQQLPFPDIHCQSIKTKLRHLIICKWADSRQWLHLLAAVQSQRSCSYNNLLVNTPQKPKALSKKATKLIGESRKDLSKDVEDGNDICSHGNQGGGGVKINNAPYRPCSQEKYDMKYPVQCVMVYVASCKFNQLRRGNNASVAC